jgi:RNA polymerase sigma factor (sigma-70 family)
MKEWNDKTNEELVVLYQKTNDNRLYEYFLERNSGLMISMISRYFKMYPQHVEDVMQLGKVAMWHAMNNYDHTKGFKFSTYYPWQIKRELNEFNRHRHLIRIPAYVLEDYEKYKADPNGRILGAISLNTEVNGTSLVASTIQDFIVSDEPNPYEVAAKKEEIARIEPLLNHLPPRQQYVMRLRLGIDDGIAKTLQQCGDIVGVTRERIRQIEEKALIALKRYAPLYYDVSDRKLNAQLLTQRGKSYNKYNAYLGKYSPKQARKLSLYIDRLEGKSRKLFDVIIGETTLEQVAEQYHMRMNIAEKHLGSLKRKLAYLRKEA